MKGTKVLGFITAVAIAVFALMLWWSQSRKPDINSVSGQLSPEYLAKRDLVSALQDLRGKRSFTHQEFDLLLKFLNDPDWRIRCRALDALRYGRFQNNSQNRKAVKAAIERLKDPEWVVRCYALRTLTGLSAKEAIPFILPLLNDPQPEVREDAIAVLKKFGYRMK